MIGALREGMQYPYPTIGFEGCRHNGIAKKRGVHYLATTESEKKAAIPHAFHAFCIEAFVSLNGLVSPRQILGKGGGVKHNDIPLPVSAAQKRNDFHCMSVMRCFRPSIFIEMPLNLRDGASGHIHGMDFRSAGLQGINTKPTGISEGIEHGTSGGITGQQIPVLALIQKKTGFLPPGEIGMKGQTIFPEQSSAGSAPPKISVFLPGGILGGQRAGGFVIYRRNRQIGQCHQDIGHQKTLAVHSDRMGLENRRLAIYVHDQTRQEIPLAMDQPESCGRRRRSQPKPSAKGPGLLQAMYDHRILRSRCPESQHLDPDTSLVIMAPGQWLTGGVRDTDPVTVGRVTFHTGHGP